MNIKVELLSDTIFGSGISVAGEEDLSVLKDSKGFPYLKGSTMRGIFREELENWLSWTEKNEAEAQKTIVALFGEGQLRNDSQEQQKRKLYFSDIMLSEAVRTAISKEEKSAYETFQLLTNTRMFTQIEDGGVKEGSLRMARCVNKGLIFYGRIDCANEDRELVENIIGCIKWLGTMKTRGFGHVRVSLAGGEI